MPSKLPDVVRQHGFHFKACDKCTVRQLIRRQVFFVRIETLQAESVAHDVNESGSHHRGIRIENPGGRSIRDNRPGRQRLSRYRLALRQDRRAECLAFDELTEPPPWLPDIRLDS